MASQSRKSETSAPPALTPKQERFVAEYLVDLNAAQAAIRAGYSPKTAKEQGARLLTNAHIQQAVQERRQQHQANTGLTVERVLTEAMRLAFFDIRKLTDETWHLVKSAPKVTGFVGGSGNRPAPITEREVQSIMRQMQEGVEKPRPKVQFEVGEQLRVTEGPFTDFNATVEDVDYDKSRLKISVLIFGRATPVEVDFAQVEKI
jgi:transcription antitermination factor NusG